MRMKYQIEHKVDKKDILNNQQLTIFSESIKKQVIHKLIDGIPQDKLDELFNLTMIEGIDSYKTLEGVPEEIITINYKINI